MNPHRSSRHLPDELAAWLADEPADEAAALREAWSAAELARPASPASDRKAALWATLEAQTADMPATPKPATARIVSLRWVAAAAVVAVLVAAGLGFWLRPVTLEAPAGTFVTASLPDGTTVELNSGSTLRYQRAFVGETRTVHLNGEAFFDVTHTGDRFVVETANAAVTVLGTQFNVRAWPHEAQAATEVTVAEGAVRLAPQDTPQAGLVLTQGLSSTLLGNTESPTPADSVTLALALAWRSNSFAFNNQPFGDILDELERRYDVRIEAGPAVRARAHSFWLQSPTNAESVLADLVAGAGLEYRETLAGYEVHLPE